MSHLRSALLLFVVACGWTLPSPFPAALGADTAWAKAKPKPKKPAKGKKPAPAPGPQAEPTPAPAPPPVAPPPAAPAVVEEVAARPSAKVDTSNPTEELLAKARQLYASLEYEAVIPVAEAVLARDDTTIDMRLDAYLLHGSALAIVGDAIEAEKPFRFLLRGRPDYDMPAETPPKILAVFRKVQVEERAIVDQMRELERARVLRELKLDAEMETESTGGVPLAFEYKLRDPGRAVQAMSVHYRRSASEPFSALALQVDDTGLWRAELPGEYTENDDGLVLQYYVSTTDAAGAPLLSVGDPTNPLGIQIAPGTVADARPFYKSPWLWIASGVVLVGAGVGGYFLYENAVALPKTDGLVKLRE